MRNRPNVRMTIAAQSCKLLLMAVRHASPEVDGAKLRELRKAAGLTVTAAAAGIGMDISYLSAVERGHRPTVSPAMFNKICAYFEIADRNELIRPLVADAA